MATQIETNLWPARAALPVARTAEKAAPWGFLEFFAISQTAFPAILFLPGTQAIRLPLRVAAFGISLFALVWWGRQLRRVPAHPAQMWLLLALGWLTIMVWHPTTNTVLTGIAQTMLYLAVLAPVFWAPGLVRQPEQLQRLLAILLICNGINSLVGVLQVYDPATWMPAEFSAIQRSLKHGMGAVSYRNDQGRLVVRPPGLFDNPGAVCGPGMIASLLGIYFALYARVRWQRAGALALAGLGLAAIYLSQVRTALLIAAGMLTTYIVILWAVQKERKQALTALSWAGLVLVLAFPLAVRFGGSAVSSRFATLTADSPLNVYYQAKRGEMLENAFFTLLPQYPFGAGLGRWGMMRFYFGDQFNPDAPGIWSELQFPSWLLDGGVPLMLLYLAAIGAALRAELRGASEAHGATLRPATAVICACNCGTLALIFGFTPFTTQVGMQYWFLTGVMFGAVHLNRSARAQ